MKSKKIKQSLVKVYFTKEFAGQKIGNIIATDISTVNFLIEKGVAKMIEKVPVNTDDNQSNNLKKQNSSTDKKSVKQKPKGRPRK